MFSLTFNPLAVTAI